MRIRIPVPTRLDRNVAGVGLVMAGTCFLAVAILAWSPTFAVVCAVCFLAAGILDADHENWKTIRRKV